MTVAVLERLERVRGAVPHEQRLHEIRKISGRSAALPVLDERSTEQILGYDESGLPA